MPNFREPMLAASTKDYTALFDGRTYLVSPKIDGIRAASLGGTAYSRTGKQFRNIHIQSLFKDLPCNLDGELLSCKIEPKITFSDYTKGIMSIKDKPDITYYIFDYIDDKMTAIERYNYLLSLKLPNWCIIVPQTPINDFSSLESLEADFLSLGYEGAMLKDMLGTYKFGRSTLKEKKLIKVKRFLDDEAKIIGFEEMFHNLNEQEKDEFGRSKRSSAQENLVPSGMLGALIVSNGKCTFKIGSGFDNAMKKEIWNNKEKYLNKIATYKYFERGMLEKPRLPIFLHFRDKDDL